MPYQRQLYCWIGLLFLINICAADETITEYKDLAQNDFKDVSYEFSENLKTWSQARHSCEEQGGELLKSLDPEIQKFLVKLSANLMGPAWWVGEGLSDSNTKPPAIESDTENAPIEDNARLCTYVIKDAFKLVTTPFCNMTLGYLCTHDLSSASAKIRERRTPQDSTDVQNLLGIMNTQASNLTAVLVAASKLLSTLETTLQTFTHDGKAQFLGYILTAVQKAITITPTLDTSLATFTRNCTGGLLLLSLELCDDEDPYKLEQLIFSAAMIYSALNMGSATQFSIELVTGTLYATRQTPASLDSMVIGTTETSNAHLPSFNTMQSQLPSSPVDVQLFSFKVNPMSGESNVSISGSVCSLSLTNSDSSAINLKNLNSYIEIFLPRTDATNLQVVNTSLKKGFSLITSFNFSDVNSSVLLSAVPGKNISFIISLSSSYQSNSSSYRANLTAQENYRWLIGPDKFHGINGTWFVNITPVNYTSDQDLPMELSIMNFKCVYWDTVLNDWSTDGCMVGPKSQPWMTHCMCNHNTFYGSSFFVMPNKVDLTRTVALFATVNENYVVVVVMSIFFFIFLLVLMWAWYADRRALRTRKITYLDDNHPCAHYNYLLNIQTGNRKDGGTTAKVYITLEGSNGETDTHQLSDPDQPVFEKGGVDLFMLSTPYPLGELHNIKLWHDNTGGSPSWFLQKVTIHDVQTKQVWHFLCSTWLSSSGDTTSKRTFNPAKKNEISSFGHIFHIRTSAGFRDEHIWMSVFNPPKHSPFNRVQRVACCMCLLLCTMVINIMFWNMPSDTQSPVIIKMGTFELTWQQIMIAVESALLMFPINILIVTIFRSIQPRVNEKDQGKTYSNNNAPVATMQSILKNSQEIVNILSKSPKNRVVAMQQSPQSTADLFAALNQMHDLLGLMLGQNDGDQHWAYCSRFVYYSLCHLSLLFDKAGDKVFPHPEDMDLAKNTVSMMLKKAESVTSSNPIQCYEPSPEEQKKKKKKPSCKLPWWFVFIGWGLLVTISGISTFFTLLYGFQYGRDSSIRWFITLILSLFQSIFVIQPLKIVGIAIFFALVLRPVQMDDDEEIDELLEEQRDKCETFTGRPMH